MQLSYFNLEYLSHIKFILIPLWRGFYFSEDILSDLHTVDVTYRLLGWPNYGVDGTSRRKVGTVRSSYLGAMNLMNLEMFVWMDQKHSNYLDNGCLPA